MEETIGAFPGIVMAGVMLIVTLSAILAIFIPFWVWRIRNEIINTNNKLDRLVELKEQERRGIKAPAVPTHLAAEKICMNCGRRNKPEDKVCEGCKAELL